MKVCVFLTLIALSGFASASVSLRWFNVPVGHYNPLIRRFFDLRYFVNDEFYVPGGPIYIYISGAFEIYTDFIERGAVYEIARDTGGLLLALEHRYFGESLPTDDASTSNLAFLTIHQAVADIGEFISFVKQNHTGASESSVILWGRGYGGSLAVWARHKFHHLVDGVWASSAPINAIIEDVDIMRNAANTIRQIAGPECLDQIEGAFNMIEDAVRARNTTHVESRLKLCSPIDVDVDEDVARLFYGIASDIASRFVTNARYPDIDDKCTIIRGLNTPENLPENALDGFARWYIDDLNRNLDCIEFNNEIIVNLYRNVEWNTISTIAGRRQTFWLQCSQLGHFPTSNNGEGHPFGNRFELPFFRQWCAQVFGEELFSGNFMEETIAKTNVMFGGLDPRIFNVFFTQGEMDPKRNLGPSRDINENSPVVVMALQSFSRDLGSPSEADYAVLLETKQQARDLILQWIAANNSPGPTEIPIDTTAVPF